MEHRFKAAAFDVDGTLLDTSEGLSASIRYTIDHFGFAPLSDEQIRTFIGPPIQNSFSKAYGLEGPILQEIATVFRDRYKEDDLIKATPYDGIYDVLAKLNASGVRPVIATYKRQDYATVLLEHFHFNDYTDIICGGDHENKLKKNDIIVNALKAAGADDYSQAVMIGDSDNDAIGAEKIGSSFIGVTYGFGFKTDDDVARFRNIGTAAEPKQISEIILGES